MTFDLAIQTIQNVAKSFPDFKKVSLEKRKTFLDSFLFSLVHKKTEIIELLQKTQKTSLAVAETEYVEAIDYLHFLKIRCKEDEPARLPIGPVLVYGSWSSPLLRFSEKVITALTLGNTVILHCDNEQKEIYDFFATLALGRFPEHSLAVIATGDKEVIDVLYSHPAIRGINFSGHSYEGEFFKNLPKDVRKKYKAHFGGRNPVIFLYDAQLENLEDLVQQSLEFHYLGEMRFNRWFVQEKIYADFVDRVCGIFEKLNVTTNGIPNSRYAEEMQRQLSSLRTEKNWHNQLDSGFAASGFAQNALSPDFNNCSQWQQQEVLGPYLTITRFKNSAEAIKFANTTFYANAAVVFSAELEKAREVAQQLTMPLVTCNRIPQRFWDKPLNSFYESGWGCDNIDMDFFTMPKAITSY